MNYNFFIGIDVSKRTLDFAVFKGKELLFKWVSENDESGIKKFIGVPNFAGIAELDCLFFTVVGDYRHSHPKSETSDSDQ